MIHFPFTLIDLTHPLSPGMPSWDGTCGFVHQTVLDYSEGNTTVAFKVQEITMQAGIGTHMDAPAHCIPQGKTIDQISLDECLAPCIIIDVSAIADEHFILSKSHVDQFEQQYGLITEGTFVIVRTGWEQYWSTPTLYRNELQFPSISIEAALHLLKRNIIGLGIDTLSADTIKSGYPVHQAILGSGKYLVENIAYAAKMPPIGGYTLAAPIFIKEATEAPIRLLGLVPKTLHPVTTSS